MVPKDKWVWYGHAGHFIVGHRCRFHMATKVGKYLVSTVGELPRSSGGLLGGSGAYEQIGAGRLYETMVFEAGEPCRAEGCECGIPDTDGHNLGFRGYNDAKAANKGHRATCAKWAKK